MNGVFSSAQRRGDGCISGDSERDNCVEKIFELKYFSPILAAASSPVERVGDRQAVGRPTCRSRWPMVGLLITAEINYNSDGSSRQHHGRSKSSNRER